jgi:MFS-type transporter involved in bile tolerance (Atg22 family)
VRAWLAALLDLVSVTAFVFLGTRAHADADPLLRVAAPFLAALAIGWLVAAPFRSPQSLRAGVVIWAMTLVGGMLLRRVGGDGTAAAFIGVATAFLAATMLGWRLAAALVSRSSAGRDRG